MRTKTVITIMTGMLVLASSAVLKAQDRDETLKAGGTLTTDQRFLLEEPNDWAWNETRLSLKLDRNVTDHSAFHAEIWARNLGLPGVRKSQDLYNKGIADPFGMELREAYFDLFGVAGKKLDLRIGRQYIAWGTADKLNPTDNLCPYDMEDVLDFGRHRATDAINLHYYLREGLSLQAVFVPVFRPANFPVGIFSNVLDPGMDLPQGLTLRSHTDSVIMPGFNIRDNTSAGLRLKGFIRGVDLSLSYVWGIDGLPFNTLNTFIPVDTLGGIDIRSELGYARSHIFGADMATNILGAGFWAEAALFLPESDVHMWNDLTALYPGSPVPVLVDSLLLERDRPYLKFIVGGDYFFPSGAYLNVQYMHGFFHERGREELHDYFFVQFEQKLFREKLTIAPLSGAVIVSDWEDVSGNYSVIYKPELVINASPNTEIRLAVVLFKGTGNNLFSRLDGYDMLTCKVKYSF